MHQSKMFWALASLLVATATANTIKDTNVTSQRDEKLFSVFQIIQFANDVCNASDGSIGTCFTAAECTAKGGIANGNCASNFGVCCTASINRCTTGNTVTFNNTFINSPGFPNGVSTAAACNTVTTGRSAKSLRMGRQNSNASVPFVYKINKISTSVSQIRLDFLSYETDAPSAGNCANGTLTITGVDTLTSRILPRDLCGVLTGQHIYLSVANSTTVTLTIALTSVGAQKWRILVSQFESTQTNFLAPRGCLQYYRNNFGTITSFNHNDGMGMQLINQNYQICIAQVDGYCDIALTSDKFDLDGTPPNCIDKLVLGVNTFCGSTFGTGGTFTWLYAGNYNLQYMTASLNANMKAGFTLSFLLLPC